MTTGLSPLIGTAGWSIPRDVAERFPAEGSTLARYASRFPCVEIDTSFYRSHRPATYARWRESVPARFRFAVKLPRTISHLKRLIDVEAEFQAFLSETAELGDRRGPLLLQLPPSFAFDRAAVEAFFNVVRRAYSDDFVVEPRHPSWFDGAFAALLQRYSMSVVVADPPRGGTLPQAATYLGYFRLHGSPKVYYSAYDDVQLRELRDRIARAAGKCWVIFDNTASGAAARNGLDLQAMVARDLGPT